MFISLSSRTRAMEFKPSPEKERIACSIRSNKQLEVAIRRGNSHKKAQKSQKFLCLLCNKAATFSFLDKVFGAHIPLLAEEGCPRHQKWIRSDLSRTPLWLRGIFLMAQLLLRLRPAGLALRALLCEEGNMTHSSSVQTATSLTFGCGAAALSLFVAIPLR